MLLSKIRNINHWLPRLLPRNYLSNIRILRLLVLVGLLPELLILVSVILLLSLDATLEIRNLIKLSPSFSIKLLKVTMLDIRLTEVWNTSLIWMLRRSPLIFLPQPNPRLSQPESELPEILISSHSIQVVLKSPDYRSLILWTPSSRPYQMISREHSTDILLWLLRKPRNLLMTISFSEEKIRCKLLQDITNSGLKEEEFSSVMIKNSYSGLVKVIIWELSQWNKEEMLRMCSEDWVEVLLLSRRDYKMLRESRKFSWVIQSWDWSPVAQVTLELVWEDQSISWFQNWSPK